MSLVIGERTILTGARDYGKITDRIFVREIKFGALMEKALTAPQEYLATGEPCVSFLSFARQFADHPESARLRPLCRS